MVYLVNGLYKLAECLKYHGALALPVPAVMARSANLKSGLQHPVGERSKLGNREPRPGHLSSQ